jgi:hypothetical protein
MLSYAFRVLNEQGYKNIATEQFNNVAEICAAILAKGISVQLKRGPEGNIYRKRMLCLQFGKDRYFRIVKNSDDVKKAVGLRV